MLIQLIDKDCQLRSHEHRAQMLVFVTSQISFLNILIVLFPSPFSLSLLLFVLVWWGGTYGSAQDLLLVLHSRNIPGGLGGPKGVPRNEPGLTMCKTSTLSTVPLFCHYYFCCHDHTCQGHTLSCSALWVYGRCHNPQDCFWAWSHQLHGFMKACMGLCLQ